jgi:hypothetical protein
MSTYKSTENTEKINKRVQELIEEFGDAKLLGILARRAKKRCRSLWRTAVVRGFQAIGIFILYVVICSTPLFIGKPTIRTSYLNLLNVTIQRGSDPCENAQIYYDKAAELLIEDSAGIMLLRSNWPGDFNDIKKNALIKWLDDNKPAIELFREGAQKPLCWSIYDANLSEARKKELEAQRVLQGQGEKSLSRKLLEMGGWADPAREAVITNEMPSLSKFRQLAYRMRYQMLYEAYIGDVNAAVADCIALHRFAQQKEGRGLLVEQLVAIAIDGMATYCALTLMEKADLTPEALLKLQSEFEQSLTLRRPVINFDSEKAAYLDIVQRCFTDDGKGDGRLLKYGMPLIAGDKESFWAKFLTMQFPSRRETLASIEAFHKNVDCRLRKTPWELHKESIEYPTWTGNTNIIMLGMLAPAYDRVGQLSWRLNCHCKAVITTAAILRYKKEKGVYPDTLEQLVAAEYLKQLPMDPYSDKPLVYRKTDNNFLLYTPGPSLVDHGGKVGEKGMWYEDGDAVFWPAEKPKPPKTAQRPTQAMPG